MSAPPITHSQLQLAHRQLQRSPWIVVLIDTFIAWQLVEHGASAWWYLNVPLTWLLQQGRLHAIGRIVAVDAPPTAGEYRRVVGWFALIGALRAAPIVQGFLHGDRDLEFVLTMVTVGTASGGIGSAAGMVRAYMAWTVPNALGLMAGWIYRGGTEGLWVAVLVALMFWLLISLVRSYGQTLDQLHRAVEQARAERDRAEAEQQRANEERTRAEAAIQARTQFFAAASHDLRQPLGVLRWYGDAVALHAQQLGNEPLQRIGEGIARALEHAEPLVRKYLDIARLEAGALDVVATDVALAPMLQRLVDDFANDAGGQRLNLAVELTDLALKVHTDPGALRSILDNLLGNAIKFTPDGGRVSLLARPSPDDPAQVRIAVQDSGQGIAPEHLNRVFEDFYQVGNPERSRSKGVGLGLSIARRLAALIGTEIGVTSQPARGSTFWFDLPRSLAASGLSAAPPPVPRDAESIGDLVPKVLVVDDEPEIREALKTLLDAKGWPIQTAADQAQALRCAEATPPDVVVLDHRLAHGEDGLDVLHALRQQQPRQPALPAVIVTGDTSPGQLRDLAAAGVPVLHKPVAGDDLCAAILKVLRSSTAP